MEIYELSKRLNLTGWVKNLSNGTVEAEIQGEEDKIIFLIEFMKSLKRATVKRVEISNLEVMEDEMRFTLIKGK